MEPHWRMVERLEEENDSLRRMVRLIAHDLRSYEGTDAFVDRASRTAFSTESAYPVLEPPRKYVR